MEQKKILFNTQIQEFVIFQTGFNLKIFITSRKFKNLAQISRNKSAISIAVKAASQPLLPDFVPDLSIACSTVSVVNTPKIIGTPCFSAVWEIPFATDEEMYSKCGVAPRMTAPRQIIASNLF